MPWHPVPRRAACTYLRAGALTCSRLIKLRSAYILCYFIRNRRYSLDFILASPGRIPRHTCRFYCCLAAHQRTKEKDSAEPLSSILWTPPPHPLGNPLRRGISAAAGLGQFRNPVSGAGRLSPVPNVVQLFVFGLVSFAFQSGCWAMVVRFSLLGDRLFVPAATWGFCYGLS